LRRTLRKRHKCAVMTFNPVYHVIDAYGRLITDSENGCPFEVIAQDVLDAVNGVASTVAIAAGGAKPFSAASAGARFAVNSAGEVTMSLRAGSAALEVTEHAALRMTERGISINAAEAALAQTPFLYFHNKVWKSGYYDPTSKIFIGTVGGRITTVINNAEPGYIENLKAAVP
jgi:hypothetical protein